MEILEVMSKEEFLDWRNNLTTIKVFRLLTNLRDQYQNQLVKGASLKMNSVEETALQTCALLHMISGLNKILEIDIDSTEEDL